MENKFTLKGRFGNWEYLSTNSLSETHRFRRLGDGRLIVARTEEIRPSLMDFLNATKTEDTMEEKKVGRSEHGKHYDTKSGKTLFDILEDLELDNSFYKSNVVKYVSRAGKKKGESELKDLKKARNYLDRLINNLEKEN